jgi:hypothetical protein
MIEMIYTVDGVSQRYTFPDDRLEELLKKADETFLVNGGAMTGDDLERYARALAIATRKGKRNGKDRR